jgi:hypothetical protein
MRHIPPISYLVACCSLLVVSGCSHQKDPVKEFQKVTAKFATLTNQVCFIGDMEDASYNVVKTESLVTPFMAVMNYTKEFSNSTGNVKISLRATFAFQEDKWVVKAMDYDDESLGRVDDPDRLLYTKGCELNRWVNAIMLCNLSR